MALFDDERLTRLTISVTAAQRRRLGELAKRAGRGVTMGRDARAALDWTRRARPIGAAVGLLAVLMPLGQRISAWPPKRLNTAPGGGDL